MPDTVPWGIKQAASDDLSRQDGMARARQETVPKTMRPLFEDLVARTDAFCLAHLDEEYA